jgi:hypothetical protein
MVHWLKQLGRAPTLPAALEGAVRHAVRSPRERERERERGTRVVHVQAVLARSLDALMVPTTASLTHRFFLPKEAARGNSRVTHQQPEHRSPRLCRPSSAPRRVVAAPRDDGHHGAGRSVAQAAGGPLQPVDHAHAPRHTGVVVQVRLVARLHVQIE